MRGHVKQIRFCALILSLGVLLTWSRPAYAVRYVEFNISIDGKAVLQASQGDEGENADIVWRYLKTLPLRPVKAYKPQPDSNNPLRATLKGKVVVEAMYGGRAEVSELLLVRESETKPWFIAPAEVERTFKSRKKPK